MATTKTEPHPVFCRNCLTPMRPTVSRTSGQLTAWECDRCGLQHKQTEEGWRTKQGVTQWRMN